jgi:HK97 family phage portal protein
MAFDLSKIFKSSRQSVSIGLDGKPDFWNVNLKSFFNFDEGTTNEYINNGYGENPYIFVVIDKIANMVASLPREFFATDGSDARPDTEYLKLLKNPNKKDSRQEFYYRIVANYLAAGEVFIHGLRPVGFSKYAELIVPTVDYVTINESGDGTVTGYNYTYFAKNYNVQPDDMLHILKPDITDDTNNGFSPLRPGRKVYQADNELRKAKASTFRNRGASGLLFNKGVRAMEPKERERLQAQYNKDTGGENRDQVYLSSTELGFIPMGIDGNLLKAIENEGLANLRDACRLYGIDSKVFGDPGASTYNNVQEAQIAAYRDVYIPLSRKIDSELCDWLLANDTVYTVSESDIDILKGVNKEEAETLKIDIESGIITVEEARAMRYPELGELPKPTVQS